MCLKPRPFGVSRPSWGQSSAGGTSVVLALPSRGPDLRGVRRRASRVSGGLTNARVVSLCLCEGSRRRGGCRPPRRAGRARTHPAPSDSWCPSGRSPRRGSCPSSRHLCPPAALGRTAPRGTAGRTSGAHTALTTSATRATSSPDRGRGARAGCPLPLRLTAGARGLAQAPCWGDSEEGVPSFRPASPRAQPPGLRGTSEARADRRQDFAGHCAATDTPSLVGTSWWPPRRLQIQPREGGSLQPKTPHLPSGSGSRQPRASPGPSHHGFAPRGRTFSRHLASHT